MPSAPADPNVLTDEPLTTGIDRHRPPPGRGKRFLASGASEEEDMEQLASASPRDGTGDPQDASCPAVTCLIDEAGKTLYGGVCLITFDKLVSAG